MIRTWKLSKIIATYNTNYRNIMKHIELQLAEYFRWDFMANFDRRLFHLFQTRHQNVFQQTYETSGASHGSTSSSGGWLIDHRPGVQFFPGRQIANTISATHGTSWFIKKTVVLQVILYDFVLPFHVHDCRCSTCAKKVQIRRLHNPHQWSITYPHSRGNLYCNR